jgi:hypothetical protein
LNILLFLAAVAVVLIKTKQMEVALVVVALVE